MKSLSTLIKLQKTRVDEQRQLLAKLLEHLDAVEKAIAEHEIRQAREQLAVQENPGAGLTYGAFVKWAIEYSRELEKQYVTAAKAVDLARGRLAELFEEQKRYEIAEAARLEEEKREEARQETIELDEIGSVGFIRKKKREKV
ncbi:MAG: hypothetical protein PHY92_03105 [Alphaproteobacteria bacterium]|nr:hypothetical protein [Alphaproteobacteria bacterium]